eukprot:6190498-Pleurochrysis_carterae.AAC.2
MSSNRLTYLQLLFLGQHFFHSAGHRFLCLQTKLQLPADKHAHSNRSHFSSRGWGEHFQRDRKAQVHSPSAAACAALAPLPSVDRAT